MNENLEALEREPVLALTEMHESSHSLLADSGAFTKASQAQFSRDIRPTGIVAGLPMPRSGDDPAYAAPSPSSPEQEKPKEEQAYEAEEQEHHKRPEIEMPLGPGIIMRPDKWFEPKEISNPFNPIWS